MSTLPLDDCSLSQIQILLTMSDHHHDCLTGCAHTYREARQAQKEKERMRGGEVREEENMVERKSKSVCHLKLGPVLPDPLEGVFKQFQCSDNFSKYMAVMGAGQMSISMILRSTVNLKITQVTVSKCSPSFSVRTMCAFKPSLDRVSIANMF